MFQKALIPIPIAVFLIILIALTFGKAVGQELLIWVDATLAKRTPL